MTATSTAIATFQLTSSTFSIANNPEYRDQPEKEFQHRLTTRHHLTYIQNEKLFDLNDPRWAKKTVNGEVVYGHAYEGSVFELRLRAADGRLTLTDNDDGSLDQHLLNNPGENIVYSLTSSNNGIESTHTFSAINAGMASVPILCLCVVLTVNLASGLAAAAAAGQAAATVFTLFGVNVTVTALPGIGLVLAVLALVGVWIVYLVEREIILNIIYENRSANKPVTLVEHYVYNVGDNPQKLPVPLKPLRQGNGFEIYDDVVINVDNVSKFKGVGVSMKFQQDDGTSVVICIRNDIYKDPYYSAVLLKKDEKKTAQQVYDECTTGGLPTEDLKWGGLKVINRLDPKSFNDYKFVGIISFNDVV